MLTVQKHLLQLLVVRQAPPVALERLRVNLNNQRELGLGQNQLVLFVTIVVQNEKLLELHLIVLRQYFYHGL